MRRQQQHQPRLNVSLFPFLAVLICTMGALVVLLVIVVQQARVEADVLSDEQLEIETQRQEWASEDAQWRVDMLLESRREMQDQLQQQRLRLAGIEDHIRQLKQELEQLEQQVRSFEQPLSATQAEQEIIQRQLNQLRQEIERRQRQLELLREQSASQERSYSILAYEGPNGTRRRPIFIECLADRVVIQPEGIILTVEDFEGPQGPGNPLAASLRAIREYLVQYDPGANQAEPYPLLVVRSHGAESYAAARRAMKSWDAEFGYELIDSEKKLQFPPADPALGQLLESTIDEARKRRVFLARATPSRFGGGHLSPGLVASPQGGFVRQDGGTRKGFGDGFRNKSEHAFGDAGPSDGGADPPHDGDPAVGAASSENSPQSQANDQQPTGKTDSKNAGGDAAGAGPTDQNVSGQASNAVSAGISPMADSRGKDWATPGKTPGAIGFTRPIRVTCFANRLVIHPERGDDRPPQIVMVPDTTKRVIEDFVSRIWTHTESWGIAGPRSYWKPVLDVEVDPSGEQRFRELQALLESSGIELQRKYR